MAETGRVARQAVVLVHGMGEQRPMDTIKSFVQTLWQQDTGSHASALPDAGRVWSKPDSLSASLELRRLTTRQSIPSPGVFDHGVRTDFHELYWADLTAGAPWSDFIGWLRTLLFRNPVTRVPRRVAAAWSVLWLVTILFVLTAIWTILPADIQAQWGVDFGGTVWRGAILALIGGGTVAMHKAVQRSFGRVARYTRATPDNIAVRQQVRERGLALLTALNNNPDYDRIILVGHSLGTILAYELLGFFWSSQSMARKITDGSPEFIALRRLEQAGIALESDADNPGFLAEWHSAQRELRRLLAARSFPTNPTAGNPRWILSDLVTLGSPLAHAEFLMAANIDDLRLRQADREMPTCPPVPEPDAKQADRYSYPLPSSGAPQWSLHHAAPFAVVRWTNISDTSRFVLCGDLISGPVRTAFGPGVRDFDLKDIRGQSWRFSHTRYWDQSADPRALSCLRQAVNLLDRP